MKMQPLFASLVLTAAASTTCAGAADLVLVDREIAPAPLILPKDATLFNKLAARDLADYLGQNCGWVTVY